MAKIMRTILQKAGIYDEAIKMHAKLMNGLKWWEIHVSLPLLKRSGLLRRIHYALFSSLFTHEMKMYAHARHHYLTSQRNNNNPVLLRRLIHQLEKGLMHSPRRPIFGLDYINKAVDIYVNLSNTDDSPESLLNWSHDVMVAYFEAVSSHPVIDKAWEKFRNNKFAKTESQLHSPYIIENQKELKLMSFDDVVRGRKSVRWFEEGKVPDRILIDEAIELASLAPSSCNRQPFEFRVFDDRELADKIMKLAPGTGGFNQNVPVVIVVNGMMNVSPSPGDLHLMYVDASLAAMNLMNGLYSRGIASCAINWPDLPKIENPLRKLIKMEEYTRPVMIIAAGYARENSMVACSTRKGVDEIRTYNK